ncbi:hypothetical protein TWF696_008452 [Orbilia brochopaga]|uniref:F-box domain-containing protein n=1 Tax=Orbilia brochopaga TaxID=3140254 RepID=A0AAV9UJ53_9PEZI
MDTHMIAARLTLDDLPVDTLLLVFDRLIFEDHLSLSLVSVRLRKAVEQYHLYRDPVLASCSNGFFALQGYHASHFQNARSLELFPIDTGSAVQLKAVGDSILPHPKKLRRISVHAFDISSTAYAIDLLRVNPNIPELTINFNRDFFAPVDSMVVLGSLRKLERLTFNSARQNSGLGASLQPDPEHLDSIWQLVVSNSATLKSLCYSVYADNDYHNIELSPTATNSHNVPPNPPWSTWRLQLHELKLQGLLEFFPRAFRLTQFFNPSTIRSLSLSFICGIDAQLLEIAGQLLPSCTAGTCGRGGNKKA